MTVFSKLTGWVALALIAATPLQAQTMGERIAARVEVDAKASRSGENAMNGARIALPDGVTGLPDLTYATLMGYRPLKLDLYLPPDRFAGPRPVIVIIHGGGWLFGSPRRTAAFADWPRTLALIASQGFAVAAISYRLGSEAPFPAALQDAKSAVRWLRGNAARFNIDKGRFVTWGDSAGGQLSAMMGVSCGVAALEPLTGKTYGAEMNPPATLESDCVQGAVAWYGAFDFTAPMGGPLPMYRHPYFDCHDAPCAPEKLTGPSAVNYVDAGDPPILLVHGSADTSALLPQSQHFLEVLRAKGVKARLEVIPDVDHGWIGKTPEATREASRRALALSIDFTASVIGDPPVMAK